MKKKLHLLFVLLFFCACAVPGLGMVFFGESQAAANEVLSPKPSLTQPDGSVNLNIMSDADDSFRKRFISLLMALPPEKWSEIENFVKKLNGDA